MSAFRLTSLASAALCLGLTNARAHARPTAVPLAAYGQRSWTVSDGLPQASVQAITQTPDGYLWVGTAGGLARFDGVTFRVHDSTNTRTDRATELLVNHDVTGLLVDRTGALWIATRAGAGLLRHRDGRFESFAGRLGMPQPGVRVLYQDARGTIWAGTRSGIAGYDGRNVTTILESDGMPLRFVRAFAEDQQGRLWVGASTGLHVFEDGKLRRVLLPPFTRPAVTALARTRDGSLWIGTDGAGVLQVAPPLAPPTSLRVLRTITRPDGLPSLRIETLLVDRTDTLWVGTQAGAARVGPGGAVASLTSDSGLPDDRVEAIALDEEDNLWLGTRAGLVRLNAGPFVSVDLEQAGGTGLVHAVEADGNDTVWVGTDGGGVLRYASGVFSRPTEAHRSCAPVVYALHRSPDGALWVGGKRQGEAALCRFDGAGRWIAFGKEQGLPQGAWVRAIASDQNGELLLGTQEGLHRLHGGRLSPVAIVGSKPLRGPEQFRSVAFDPEGRVWAGGAMLRVGQGDEWRHISVQQGLSKQTVYSILFDTKGDAWLGTARGLTYHHGGRFTPFHAENGLIDDPVRQAIDDGMGRLWLCTPKGILRVDKGMLAGVAAGRLERVSFSRYGAADGMKVDQCEASWGNPAGARTADGRIWFPTRRGLTWVDPARVAAGELAAPRIHIEGLFVDDRPLAAGGAAPPGRGAFEVKYTALSFRAPERLRFRYRLSPFDADWVDAGPRRVASYTNLPPGHYRFAVMARNNDGVWSTTQASVSFTLHPHFHQTAGFKLLLAAAFAGFGLLGGLVFHRERLRRLRLAHAAVVKERTRIARELHDTLAQGLSAVCVQLANIADSAEGSREDVLSHVEKARRIAEDSIADARRTVRNLRDLSLSGTGLVDRIQQMAEALQGSTVVRVAVAGTPAELLPDHAAEILRIAQEAMTNAVRHAQASLVLIELTFDPAVVTLRVHDNGRGFDVRQSFALAGHYGLAGMRERVASLGGELVLDSTPGSGTEIIVRVPSRSALEGAG